jgi:hypothetical protein
VWIAWSNRLESFDKIKSKNSTSRRRPDTIYWMWQTASRGGWKYPPPHQLPSTYGTYSSVQMFTDDLCIGLRLLISPWSVHLRTPEIILARSSHKVGAISEMKNKNSTVFGGHLLKFLKKFYFRGFGLSCWKSFVHACTGKQLAAGTSMLLGQEPESLERGDPCRLLKLRWMETQKVQRALAVPVQETFVLPWLL